MLMSLNMAKTKLKKPYHVPILWVKNYGDGKVMHMSLGHNESVWENETYRESLLGGIQWVLNLEEGRRHAEPRTLRRAGEEGQGRRRSRRRTVVSPKRAGQALWSAP